MQQTRWYKPSRQFLAFLGLHGLPQESYILRRENAGQLPMVFQTSQVLLVKIGNFRHNELENHYF